jgi:hypothetical protein
MTKDRHVCYGGRSSVGRAQDCDSCGRGFEPHRPPHLGTSGSSWQALKPLPVALPHLSGPLAQLVEQWTLNPSVVGSNPTRPTNKISGLHCRLLNPFTAEITGSRITGLVGRQGCAGLGLPSRLSGRSVAVVAGGSRGEVSWCSLGSESMPVCRAGIQRLAPSAAETTFTMFTHRQVGRSGSRTSAEVRAPGGLCGRPSCGAPVY